MDSKILTKRTGFIIGTVVILTLLGRSQSATQQPSQETVDKRIIEIMGAALQKGVVTLSDGVQVTPMKASTSLEELREIRGYGERAIPGLSKYLDSTDLRAETLAVNLIGAVGGKSAVSPLSYAAERCASPVARFVAVENLGQQTWADVIDVIERVSTNDRDPLVRKAALELISKHRSNPPNP